MHRDKSLQRWIFLFFLALYLLAMGDHFGERYYASDENLMAMTTAAIVEDHSLHIPETYGTTTPKFGILQSVAAIPAYLVAKTIIPHLPRPLAEPTTVYLLFTTCAFLTAWLLARFYAFSRWLRYPRPAALAATLALGLTTVLFPYARMFFSEPLVALTLLGAVAGLARHARSGRALPALAAGAWFGLALLARQDNLALLPVFLLLINYNALRMFHLSPQEKSSRSLRPEATFSALRQPCRFEPKRPTDKCSLQRQWNATPLRRALRGMALFMAPLTGALAVQLTVNALRYGSPFSSGYGQEAFSTPLFAGLYGLLVSPGRGVLIYSPPLLAALWFFPHFLRRRRLVALAALWIFTLKLFLFAGWWSWQGGWSWGSRFLLPALPLLFLSLNEVFMRWRRLGGVARAAVLALLALGFWVQLLGVLANPNKHGNDIWAMTGLDENQFLFIPQLSVLAGNWPLIRAGFINSFMMRFGEFYGAGALVAVAGGLAALLIVSAWGLARGGGLGGALLARLRGAGDFKIDNGRARTVAGLAILNLLIFIICAGAGGAGRIGFASSASGWKSLTGRPQNRVVMLEDAKPELDATGRPAQYEWRGVLLAPLNGEYTFHLKVSGFYRLAVDGQELLVNASEPKQHVRSAKIALTQGLHSFSLRYQPVAAAYRLARLYWTAPGFGIYRAPLTSRWLFEAPPSRLLLALLALDHMKWLVLVLSLMAGYVAWGGRVNQSIHAKTQRAKRAKGYS